MIDSGYRPVLRRADDVVIIQFGGLILFSVGRGILPYDSNCIQVLNYLGGPVARQGHARIVDRSFGKPVRVGGIGLVSKRHPVKHDWPARVDGETDTIT